MPRPASTPPRISSRPHTSSDWRPRWVASVVRSWAQSDGFLGAAGLRRAGAFFLAAAAGGRFFGRARVAVTVSTTVTVASRVFTGCVRRASGIAGLVLHGLTAVFPYAASGLLAPLYGYVLV